MKLLFVTGNEEKFKEAKQVIPELEQLNLDLDEIQAIDPKVVIEHKLKQAIQTQKGNLIVEDNSLFLNSLNGLPGPLIKWFLKTIGNEGLVKISQAMNNDLAEAKVVIGYQSEDGKVEYFEGYIKGKIVEPRGENGFGWDPIFQPDNETKTFGEMTLEEKSKISMRRIAFQKLKDYLH
jgi:non-canonical purine NTP pyrophosphatase (RdgB/HAM1 family)